MLRCLVLLILATLHTSAVASTGRQLDHFRVTAAYSYACHWVEKNCRAIETSTGASILEDAGDTVRLRKTTKRGTYEFRLQRIREEEGHYRGVFLDRQQGDLVDHSYEIWLRRKSQEVEITVFLTATVKDTNMVSINIELRKSIRGIRDLLQQELGRGSE